MIVRQPEFFSAIATLLDQVSLADWKLWCKWNVLNETAELLSKPYVNEHFAFFGKVLTGAPKCPRAGSAASSSSSMESVMPWARFTWPSTSRPRPRPG